MLSSASRTWARKRIGLLITWHPCMASCRRSYAFSRTAPRKSGPFGAASNRQWRESEGFAGFAAVLELKDDGLMADPLAEQYADLLEGTYDCVDRIILNAYFPKGMNGGGFR